MHKYTYFFDLPDEVSGGVLPSEVNTLPFTAKYDFMRRVNKWKSEMKSTWASQKRHTLGAAMKEFRGLYKPKYYFTQVHAEPDYYDDTFEIWYQES